MELSLGFLKGLLVFLEFIEFLVSPIGLSAALSLGFYYWCF